LSGEGNKRPTVLDDCIANTELTCGKNKFVGPSAKKYNLKNAFIQLCRQCFSVQKDSLLTPEPKSQLKILKRPVKVGVYKTSKPQ
jgi:hypothetical protein